MSDRGEDAQSAPCDLLNEAVSHLDAVARDPPPMKRRPVPLPFSAAASGPQADRREQTLASPESRRAQCDASQGQSNVTGLGCSCSVYGHMEFVHVSALIEAHYLSVRAMPSQLGHKVGGATSGCGWHLLYDFVSYVSTLLVVSCHKVLVKVNFILVHTGNYIYMRKLSQLQAVHVLPVLKAAHCKNYGVEAFTLLAQYEYLLSPRMAMQRTINMHGCSGKNVPTLQET